MKILIAAGVLVLATFPALADSAPGQTPAQLQASGPASAAPAMTSQADIAAADQSGKSQTTAQLAAKTPHDNGHDDGGAATDATHLTGNATVDTGRDDGGAAK